MTAVAGSVFTAAQFNQSVRDNLNETAPAKASGAGQWFISSGVNAISARTIVETTVDTAESTASTSYTALTTPGPSVTVTTGTRALVFVSARVVNSTAGTNSIMGYVLSGSSSFGPNDNEANWQQSASTTSLGRATAVSWPNLTAGSNTFTSQYKVTAGTATFAYRSMIVMAL